MSDDDEYDELFGRVEELLEEMFVSLSFFPVALLPIPLKTFPTFFPRRKGESFFARPGRDRGWSPSDSVLRTFSGLEEESES